MFTFRREPRDPRERSSSWAASIAVHVVLAALVLPLALGSERVATWLGFLVTERPRATEERLVFVREAAPRPEPVPSGNDKVSGGRAAPPRVLPPPPPTPPSEVPSDAPALAPSAFGDDETARGDGSGGPLEGIRPSFSDPRIYVVPDGRGNGTAAISNEAVRSRVDSLIRAGVLPMAYMDSLARMNGQVVERAPGDWTVRGPNGERWGIDGGFIRLGKFSLPTALLALLPLNTGQMNVQQMENQRRISQLSADIRWQAQKAMNEDEFRAAVKRIRLRKERERAEAEKAKQQQAGPVAGGGVVP